MPKDTLLVSLDSSWPQKMRQTECLVVDHLISRECTRHRRQFS